MPKLRVHNFSVSLDGYGAGPDQSLESPLGARGEELHNWMFETRTWHKMSGEEGGDEGWMTVLPLLARLDWARPSWAAICSGRSAGIGPTRMEGLVG